MSAAFSFPRTPSALTRQSLSPEQQRLLAVFQRIRYGRVPRLVVRSGQPDMHHLDCIRTIRLPGANQPHPAGTHADFPLKQEVREFFAQLAALGDGEIRNLQIWDGLPRSYEIPESLGD